MEYLTLTFAKNGQSLDLLSGFPIPVCQRLELERSYLADVRQPLQSLLLG